MTLHATDERRMLEESVGGLLGGSGGEGPAEAVWAGLAALGLPAMLHDEADGGLGTSPADAMLVARLLGRDLRETPFLAGSIVSALLLRRLATPDQKQALLPPQLEGREWTSFAHAEPNARYARAAVATRAVPGDGGYVITGTKTHVWNAAGASHLILSARIEGVGPDGLSLFVVPAGVPGLRIRPYAETIGRVGADVVLDGVLVPADRVLGPVGQCGPAIEEALDHAAVGLVNEAVGAMEALLDLTVDYLKLRRQFGVPIGSFQALRHRAVDMLIEVEQARSMADYAAILLEGEPGPRSLAVAAATLYVLRAARSVGEAAVQLHGAIGMTLESKVGRLFRRLATFRLVAGDEESCLRTLSTAETGILDD